MSDGYINLYFFKFVNFHNRKKKFKSQLEKLADFRIVQIVYKIKLLNLFHKLYPYGLKIYNYRSINIDIVFSNNMFPYSVIYHSQLTGAKMTYYPLRKAILFF